VEASSFFIFYYFPENQPIAPMSERERELIAEAQATGAKHLDLGRCGLYEWPEALFELTELESLTLSNRVWDGETREWIPSKNTGPYNLLRNIPPEIQRLQKLKKLEVGGSGTIRIFGYPVFIDEWGISDISVLQGLHNLQSLDLGFNKSIQDFSVLQGLHNLQSLDLRANNISDISPILPLIKGGIRVVWDERNRGNNIYLYNNINLYECPLTTPPRRL